MPSNTQFIKHIAAILVLMCPCVRAVAQESIASTTPCELASKPEAFNHKLVKLSGDVTHGYKLFTLSGACKSNLSSIWLDYGGLVNAPSVFNAGQANVQRSQPLVIEGVLTTLLDDSLFKGFNKQISAMSDRPQARVTLIGRYFAGHPEQIAEFKLWKGFGPMGCCTLLVIQQVVAVENIGYK